MENNNLETQWEIRNVNSTQFSSVLLNSIQLTSMLNMLRHKQYAYDYGLV